MYLSPIYYAIATENIQFLDCVSCLAPFLPPVLFQAFDYIEDCLVPESEIDALLESLRFNRVQSFNWLVTKGVNIWSAKHLLRIINLLKADVNEEGIVFY